MNFRVGANGMDFGRIRRHIVRSDNMSFFRKKWKLCLYLNGIYVGKVKINENENPSKENYLVHFWFKPQIFKALHVKSIVHPTRLLKTDDKKKETHWIFEYEDGVEMK